MTIKDTPKGILLILLSAIAFSAMAALVKYIPHISSSSTAFYRFAIGLGILGFLAFIKKIKLRFNDKKYLLLRGITGGISVFIYYFSITKIGIAKASVYNYSYPIFASIFSIFILKEKIPFGKWFLILIAFIGIILLSFDFHTDNFLINYDLYELFALLGASMVGISIVYVKKLHNTDDSYAIFFAQCIIGFWLFIIPSSTVNFTGNMFSGIILLSIGITATIGQLLMTEGFKYTSVYTGSGLHLVIPVLNAGVGIIIFGEKLGVWEIIGASTIILSCLGIIFYSRIFKK